MTAPTPQPSGLKVEEKPLHVPCLQDVAEALQEGLNSHFQNVSVEVVNCPDLTAAPFSLASEGLCGSTRVVEFGGLSNFMPLYNPEKVYDLRHFNSLLGVDPAAVVGTGAGPFSNNNHFCCEFLANSHISKGQVKSLNCIAKITEANHNGYVNEFLPKEETKFSLMANLFVSNGNPGKVLKIQCKNRIKQDDFPGAIRTCLAEKFKGHNIGLGGVFLVKGSKVRNHIPPNKFSSKPIETQEQFNNWLKFFNMNPPLVFVGTILTHHLDMDMILQHFHSFSEHGDGGHYHYDISPQTVEYLAYFNLAERAVHVDRPARTTSLVIGDIQPTA